ncbi:uncharacterized protein LOC129750607 [Uranotaenia lowii]|uniref:uncharacterized protein LOC129750607 n=1 Tax=Uranotaenia lowii TaxID=190385 RepID=UPI00247A7AF8|nr:uncharacterized protein LOC129750607 [Uranotaenia lowii]
MHIIRPMLFRMGPVASGFSKNVTIRRAHVNLWDNFKKFSMNDRPVPEGDFMTHWNKRQRFYNMMLAGGFGSFVIAMGMVIQSGLVFLNFVPPETYE